MGREGEGVSGSPQGMEMSYVVKRDSTCVCATQVKELDNDPNMSRADSNGVLPKVVHKSWMKLARWEWFISAEMTSSKIESILAAMRMATEANPRWSKAWRYTGLFNVAAMNHFAMTVDNKKAHSFVAPAINAFFKSISFNRLA